MVSSGKANRGGLGLGKAKSVKPRLAKVVDQVRTEAAFMVIMENNTPWRITGPFPLGVLFAFVGAILVSVSTSQAGTKSALTRSVTVSSSSQPFLKAVRLSTPSRFPRRTATKQPLFIIR